jgi:hypothetical protein
LGGSTAIAARVMASKQANADIGGVAGLVRAESLDAADRHATAIFR